MALVGCGAPAPGPFGEGAGKPEVSRANGEWVFRAGGCASCHGKAGAWNEAAPALGGGQVINSRYGQFLVPNISPDPETGIGTWSLADFDRAMRQGLAPDGHAYYPAFPYTSYTRMSDADIADLHAFLATLPPVRNEVGTNRLGFPAKLPMAAGTWRRMFLRPGPAVRLAGASDEVARGQYIVEGPGHCGTCHTPRGAFGGPLRGRWLGGAEMLDDSGGYAPNLTPHDDGLGGWSAAEIVEMLHPAGPPDEVGEGMAAVRINFSRLPESDRYAIAAYLKALPPVASRD